MTSANMKKTEDAILKIREELNAVVIPEVEILDNINYEMADIFEALKNLKNKIESLENQFGPLDGYGIADELENLEV